MKYTVISPSENFVKTHSFRRVSDDLRKLYIPIKFPQKAEAVTQMCSTEKVFWKHAANLQENTHAEVWFQ